MSGTDNAMGGTCNGAGGACNAAGSTNNGAGGACNAPGRCCDEPGRDYHAAGGCYDVPTEAGFISARNKVRGIRGPYTGTTQQHDTCRRSPGLPLARQGRLSLPLIVGTSYAPLRCAKLAPAPEQRVSLARQAPSNLATDSQRVQPFIGGAGQPPTPAGKGRAATFSTFSLPFFYEELCSPAAQRRPGFYRL
jgi:hypothetical protein